MRAFLLLFISEISGQLGDLFLQHTRDTTAFISTKCVQSALQGLPTNSNIADILRDMQPV